MWRAIRGWGFLNRDRLLPTREQAERAEVITQRFREKAGRKMRIFFVVPDYFEKRPKPCMSGWGSVFLTVAPDGTALPCHAARMLPGLEFPNIRNTTLDAAWHDSDGFNCYRGNTWMKEPYPTAPNSPRISEAAVVRPICSPATRQTPIQSATCRPITTSSPKPWLGRGRRKWTLSHRVP